MALPISLRLAIRQWLARPLRPLLCSLAIAAAVALVLCVGAGFDSLKVSLGKMLGQMLGVAEVHIRHPQRGINGRVSADVLDKVRARPEVELAAGRVQTSALIKPLTPGAETRWYDTVGVDTAHDEELRPKPYLAGRAPRALEEVALDQQISDKFSLKLGDKAEFSTDGLERRQVTIVGIIKRPAIELLSRPTIYVPIDQLAKDLGIKREYNVIDIKTRPGAVEDFDAYAKSLGKELGEGVQVVAGTTSKAKMTEETRAITMGLLLISVISGLCAALIIGTTLSVGVQERVRQFGQLRCIGASRRHLAVFLLADAIVLMTIGTVLGLLVGGGLAYTLVKSLPQFFTAFEVTPLSLMIAIGNGIIATLGGSAVPMWQVTRVTPMAAVRNVAQRPKRRKVWLAALVGFILVALQLTIWFSMPTRDLKFYTYASLGMPLIFIGYVLLGPAVLVLAEKFAAPLMAKTLFIRGGLLKSAWSRTPWRSGAMIAALMIGVTIFTTVRGRGESILHSWDFPSKFPDLFLFSPAPVSEKRLAQIKADSADVKELTSLAAFPTKMPTSVFSIGEVMKNTGTMFVAVDPATFPGMVEMTFIQGNAKDGYAKLAAGGHLFVSKEFHIARKLGMGDKITLLSADNKPVDFTIAAVVSSNGMDMVKNYFDMRTVVADQAVSSVLGSIADAKTHFKLRDPNIVLANFNREMKPEEVSKFRELLVTRGFQSASSVEMKQNLKSVILNVVNAMSLIAIGALAVASLGVANMVIASIHARRFEFGVLRAIGSGRGQLVRLILAEVSMIACVAGLLGTLAGLHYTFMGTQVDRVMVGFPTTFIDPSSSRAVLVILSLIAVSVAITTALAWLSSIVPAVRGAMAAQRTLLAGGRA